jgi:hypothetical protein
MTPSRLLQLAPLLALVAAIPARAADTPPILPGYWESTDRLEVLIPTTKVTHKCLTADQVTQWLTAPATRHYSCTYDQRKVGDGRAYFHGTCMDKRGRTLTVAINGTYAPEHFHLAARFNYMLTAGVGIPGDAITDAHRLSAECPAGVEPGK